MDAATLINALRSGDIVTFIGTMEWDERFIPVTPPGMIPDGEMIPFSGLFGVATFGAIQHGNEGKYELRIHTHPDEQAARECFDRQVEEITQTLALAELMSML
jgi:hypothetical protein